VSDGRISAVVVVVVSTPTIYGFHVVQSPKFMQMGMHPRYLQMGNAGDLIVQKPASNPLPQADPQILEE
jgi:hypothetical protein